VAGYRLRDALNAYAGKTFPGDDGTSLNSNLDFVAHDDASLNSNLDLNIAARHELPDIVVPQIGLSVRAIVSTMRSVLHRTGHAISGELTLQDGKYALRVRIDGRQVFSTNYEAENPDDLMTKAAPWVMDIIRPAAHAMARYRVRKEEGLLKADEIIAHHKKSDINVQWAYLLAGKHALGSNNYEQAAEMFSNAVSSNWNSEQSHIQLGVSLLRQGKPDEAIKQFRNVIAINPKSAIAYNNIGVALATQANQKKGELDVAKLKQAIPIYEQAIKAEPGYVIPYNNLGLAQFHSEDIDNAIVSYRSAVGIAPKYLLARWNLAHALRMQREFDASETEYRAAIELATDTKQLAILHTYLGSVLWDKAGKNGNLDEAVLEYRRAIELSCYGWAHYNLGEVWRGQGKIKDALAQFDKASTCEPKDETLERDVKQARLLLAQQASAVTTGQAKR
jgi:superkiller protein 3